MLSSDHSFIHSWEWGGFKIRHHDEDVGVSWKLISCKTWWWFQIFFIFIPTWGNDVYEYPADAAPSIVEQTVCAYHRRWLITPGQAISVESYHLDCDESTVLTRVDCHNSRVSGDATACIPTRELFTITRPDQLRRLSRFALLCGAASIVYEHVILTPTHGAGEE